MKITKQEFQNRIERIQDAMGRNGLDGLMVYGDEYRKENLRYVSNFWPIFERGACFIPRVGKPILAGAPEGEQYAREMSVWSDIRNIKDFACVSVPEEMQKLNYVTNITRSLDTLLGDNLSGALGLTLGFSQLDGD